MAMTTNEQRLEVLFDKYIQQSISATEEQELMALLADASLAAKREALIEKVYDNSTADFSLTPEQSAIFTANQEGPYCKIPVETLGCSCIYSRSHCFWRVFYPQQKHCSSAR
jgi:hypothetical protein